MTIYHPRVFIPFEVLYHGIEDFRPGGFSNVRPRDSEIINLVTAKYYLEWSKDNSEKLDRG